jgi:hypothetical protein
LLTSLGAAAIVEIHSDRNRNGSPRRGSAEAQDDKQGEPTRTFRLERSKFFNGVAYLNVAAFDDAAEHPTTAPEFAAQSRPDFLQ